MFKKILIANRGEIAARIIKTCKELGIKTVAIYSEADVQSLHVKLADESYLVGPPRVNESYLNVDKIIEIAIDAQVDAIHPGYGFMSESSLFAKKCIENNIVFIGPTPDVLESMGDKITARKMMASSGVPIVPGTETGIHNIVDAIKSANEIGYPIMLKSSAGGGGIGMQNIANDEELHAAFENNQKRAETFFGSGTMFLEKLLVNIRHIEVQVLHDEHGNGIHLFERECSIQRRNQKVIEEAPSSFISEETRNEMGAIAVRAGNAIGYSNAGTIEFLVDDDENFYFLEMNPRIQVEHAITEEITGVDIVKQQLLIANGEKLTLKQSELKINGYAIEARIYAEDPKTFFPSPGQITVYEEPIGDYIRIESAINANSVVTPFYDPLISKLIVKGSTRKETIARLKVALQNYNIRGIKTNIPMLIEVVSHEQFELGNTKTDFLHTYFL